MTTGTKYLIAGIGELLWDIFPEGRQLGGAPCNFSYHTLQAGNDACVINAIGKDESGYEILKKFAQLGLNKDFLQTNESLPTGTVSVKLNSDGVPDYTIHENVAWDNIVWDNKLESLAAKADAVCFGSLAQRNKTSRQTIWRFLEKTREDCLKIFDINLRQSFHSYEIITKSLAFANILKLNKEELPVIAKYIGIQGNSENLLSRLMDIFQLKMIVYTKGNQGSLLLTPHESSSMAATKIKMKDSVGAGDSFTAILICGLLKKNDLRIIHKAATEIAAFVCTQKGATPKIPKKLLNLL